MESICKEHDQNVGRETSQMMADCFCNAVVVRKILKEFSDPELLKLSFVNKLWNYEARSLMRKRGNIIARLDPNNGRSQGIQAFALNLQKMNIVPFCGIRMVLRDMYESCECKVSALALTNDAISFDPLPFKTLSVQLSGKRSSPGFLHATSILEGVCEVLEEFTLQIPFAAEIFIHDCVQKCSFPRLRILKLRETNRWHVTGDAFANYVKVLISRAPNLKELHSDRPPRVLLDVVEGSSVAPVCSYQVYAPFDELSDDVIKSGCRLERMSLICFNGRSFDFDRFNRICPMLLQASCSISTTICDLTVDAVLALPLMCYGIRLENLRKLTMGINYRELKLRRHHRVLRLLKGFDFTRIFPNLTKVLITNASVPEPLPIGLKRFIEEANISRSMPDRAVYIKELHSEDCVLDSRTAQYFAEMFPNIQRLYVEKSSGFNEFMLGTIRENWVHLKELHIKSKVLEDTKNLDGVFCGIFFEELVLLMHKDEEYLKRVNIVPVKPSITCLRNLRVLSLEYDLKRRPEPIIYDATFPMFFLSKITGLVALARCPNLAVTLKISPDGAHAGDFTKN